MRVAVSEFLRGVAFLDTNALHFLGLYVRLHLMVAPEENRFPVLNVPEDSDPPLVAKMNRVALGRARMAIEKQRETGERGAWRAVEQGLSVIEFLLGKNFDYPYRVEYAPVSELELIEGRVFGAAVQKYAREGAPYRMWSRRLRDGEVADRIGPELREDIWKEVEGLRNSVSSLGIEIEESSPSGAAVTMELATRLLRWVHLSFADAMVYASAARVGAECLLTTDKYLCGVVNSIKIAEIRGEDGRYADAAAEIRRTVGKGGKVHVERPVGYLVSRSDVCVPEKERQQMEDGSES